MIANQNNPKKQSRRRRKRLGFVMVSARSYGSDLRGSRIFFEGERPKGLKDDGSIKFGKHILQILRQNFRRFRLIVTPKKDSIQKKGGVIQVRISQRLLGRMNSESWDRTRDIKNDIVRRFLASAFPGKFTDPTTPVYVPGTLATLLSDAILPRLSADDRSAITKFIPRFVATESIGSVSLLNAQSQIRTLQQLADDLESQLGRDHSESWWQEYIKAKILILQQGYIKSFDKLNVALGGTKFPDFCLITHDNYLDILEIKKPNTPVLHEDPHRKNFYWDTELTKAISQTENYIKQVSDNGNALRSHLKDAYGLETKVVRPRGIILAGDSRNFSSSKEQDDFRLLSQGMKNITILTYDELLTRVKNYIAILQEFSRKLPKKNSRKHRS